MTTETTSHHISDSVAAALAGSANRELQRLSGYTEITRDNVAELKSKRALDELMATLAARSDTADLKAWIQDVQAQLPATVAELEIAEGGESPVEPEVETREAEPEVKDLWVEPPANTQEHTNWTIAAARLIASGYIPKTEHAALIGDKPWWPTNWLLIKPANAAASLWTLRQSWNHEIAAHISALDWIKEKVERGLKSQIQEYERLIQQTGIDAANTAKSKLETYENAQKAKTSLQEIQRLFLSARNGGKIDLTALDKHIHDYLSHADGYIRHDWDTKTDADRNTEVARLNGEIDRLQTGVETAEKHEKWLAELQKALKKGGALDPKEQAVLDEINRLRRAQNPPLPDIASPVAGDRSLEDLNKAVTDADAELKKAQRKVAILWKAHEAQTNIERLENIKNSDPAGWNDSKKYTAEKAAFSNAHTVRGETSSQLLLLDGTDISGDKTAGLWAKYKDATAAESGKKAAHEATTKEVKNRTERMQLVDEGKGLLSAETTRTKTIQTAEGARLQQRVDLLHAISAESDPVKRADLAKEYDKAVGVADLAKSVGTNAAAIRQGAVDAHGEARVSPAQPAEIAAGLHEQQTEVAKLDAHEALKKRLEALSQEIEAKKKEAQEKLKAYDTSAKAARDNAELLKIQENARAEIEKINAEIVDLNKLWAQELWANWNNIPEVDRARIASSSPMAQSLIRSIEQGESLAAKAGWSKAMKGVYGLLALSAAVGTGRTLYSAEGAGDMARKAGDIGIGFIPVAGGVYDLTQAIWAAKDKLWDGEEAVNYITWEKMDNKEIWTRVGFGILGLIPIVGTVAKAAKVAAKAEATIKTVESGGHVLQLWGTGLMAYDTVASYTSLGLELVRPK